LESESRRTDHGGWAVYASIPTIVGGSYSDDRATTVSRSTATLSDVDGDGFVDLVSGTTVAFNGGTGDYRDNGTFILGTLFLINHNT
jgi:hypothetical protein